MQREHFPGVRPGRKPDGALLRCTVTTTLVDTGRFPVYFVKAKSKSLQNSDKVAQSYDDTMLLMSPLQ